MGFPTCPRQTQMLIKFDSVNASLTWTMGGWLMISSMTHSTESNSSQRPTKTLIQRDFGHFYPYWVTFLCETDQKEVALLHLGHQNIGVILAPQNSYHLQRTITTFFNTLRYLYNFSPLLFSPINCLGLNSHCFKGFFKHFWVVKLLFRGGCPSYWFSMFNFQGY